MDSHRKIESVEVPESLNFIAPYIVPDLIRLGNENDGGYVVPKTLLNKVDTLISLGLSDNWTFDADFKSLNKDLTIHCYDHTVSKWFFLENIFKSSIKFVSRKSTLSQVYHKFQKYREYKSFFTSNNIHFVQRVHNRIDKDYDVTFETIMRRTNGKNVFLKMDIEGSEYKVLSHVKNHVPQIFGLVVEFHETELMREIFTAKLDELLLHYSIIHIHPNNYGGIASDGMPEVLEITFLRIDLSDLLNVKRKVSLTEFDSPCNRNKPEIQLLF